MKPLNFEHTCSNLAIGKKNAVLNASTTKIKFFIKLHNRLLKTNSIISKFQATPKHLPGSNTQKQ